jgi:hypothetical protein
MGDKTVFCSFLPSSCYQALPSLDLPSCWSRVGEAGLKGLRYFAVASLITSRVSALSLYP